MHRKSLRPTPRAQACAMLALCSTVVAAQTSPYYVGGGVSFSADSNLLRLSDGQATPLGYSKSDRVTSTSLLAGLDQTTGRQRVFGNLALRANRFADNRIYDNQGYTARLGLDWSTAGRLSGSLSGSASRNLSSFNLQEIGLLAEKNLESVQALDAALRLGLVTQYSLEAALGTQRVKNSLDSTAVQARNYQQDTASLGLRWRPGAASSLGLALRTMRGRYPKFRPTDTGFEADRFKRRDIDLTATWQPSGASNLDLRLSSGKTEYDLATQRNYSGITGTLGWSWQLSGKVNLSTRLTRETGQDSYAVTTFFGKPGTTDYSRITDSLRVKADYALSAKLSLSAAAVHADHDLVRTLPGFFDGTEQAQGRDRTTAVSLGLRWLPLRSLSLGCELGSERRRGSGELGSDLRGHTYGCYGQFTLQ